MLARVLVVMSLCVAACAVARAQGVPIEVPIVVGDDVGGGESRGSAAGPDDVADPDSPPSSAVPESVLVEESASSFDASAFAPPSPASCIDATCAGTSYTSFDALFLQRINTVGPLAIDSYSSADPGATVIAAGDVRYPTSFGARLFQGWRRPDDGGVEVGYLGVWGMFADDQAVSSDGSLALPGQLGSIQGSGFDAATAIRPVLVGNLNSLEVNLFTTRTQDGCQRHDPLPWRRVGMVPTVDWILGVRWAGLDEEGTLSVTAATPAPSTTAYRVTTSSHLVGPQLGHRRKVEWGDWALDGWIKAAAVASFLSQSQGTVVGPYDLLEIRGPRSSTLDGMGFIGDVNAMVVRRLGDGWSLRAGYTLLWFPGVAPAAEQWDFTNVTTSGSRLVPGTVFLHGATLGLEAGW